MVLLGVPLFNMRNEEQDLKRKIDAVLSLVRKKYIANNLVGSISTFYYAFSPKLIKGTLSSRSREYIPTLAPPKDRPEMSVSRNSPNGPRLMKLSIIKK
ncbi:UNVERIFIED_CONTAM: hypothetical protein NCL1_23349 [Trichonephila clavipes]